jgi:hypothetical protein
MNYLKTLWALPLIGFLAMPATAENRHYNFEQQIDKQHMKIKKSVKSGDLTKREAKLLRKEHIHIAKLNKLFMQDGKLNRFEKRTLKNELKAARQHIKELSHNDQYRKRTPRDQYAHLYGYMGIYSLN